MMADHDNDHDHETFLDMCKFGETEEVRMALATGMDANTRGDFGEIGLLNAACNGHVEIMDLLIQAGADADSKDNMGHTALMEAAGNGGLAAVEFLLSKPEVDAAAKDNDGWTALHYAAGEGYAADPDILGDLLNIPAVDPNAPNLQDKTPIMLLLEDGGSTEMLQVFVDDDRVDIEHEGLEDLAR